MLKWMVRLVGPEKELQLLRNGMTTRSCRVTEDGGEFYLHSQRFDPLSDAWAVKDIADKIIEHAGLAALVRHGRYPEISTASVIKEGRDGSRTPYNILATAEEVCEALSLEVVAGEQRQISSEDIAVFKNRPFLAEAAAHLRGDPDWWDYWKAAEALGADLGGLMQGEVPKVSIRGWASENDWKRFIETVHHYRHRDKPLPDNPMAKDEADVFFRSLLRKCLDQGLKARA